MAAPGPQNIVARRVTDDLIAFSGETTIPRYMKFFLVQKLAESRRFVNRMLDEVETVRGCIGQLTAVVAEPQAMDDQDEVHDSLLAAKDAKRGKKSKVTTLNEVIAEALADIEILEMNVEILDGENNVVDLECITYLEEASLEALMRDVCCLLWVSLSKKRRLAAELEALREQGDAVRALENMKEIVSHDSVTLADLEQLLARAQVGLGLKDGYLGDVGEKA
ncbi:hypothetical protein Tco_0739174 [Tanacetum coccineum]